MNAVNSTILKLIVDSDFGYGNEYSISNDQRIIIGRGGNSNIKLLNDSLVSREHCGIYFSNSNFIVRDLSSSNGTQLNDCDIDIEKIKDEDILCIGSTLFRVKIESSNAINTGHTEQDNVIKNDVVSDEAIQNKPLPPFSLFTESSDEPSPLIQNQTSFVTELVPWKDQQGNDKVSIVAKITYKMLSGKEPQLSEKSIPIFKQNYFYDDKDHGSILYESDLAPFKPQADIVIVGKAHTPNNEPRITLDVGLLVGNFKKVIKIFGDREWVQVDDEGFEISEPLPFTTMDLIYERSFGGSDPDNDVYNRQNPVGCGCIVEESLNNKKLCRLPNIEDPHNLIDSWETRPDSVGLGFYANNWEPRIQYLGQYEENEVQENKRLGLPHNFSPLFYNSAHPDLQVKGYLKGDEKVELVNLSSKGRLIFNLSNIKPDVVISKKKSEEKETDNMKCDEKHLKMNLDTLVFIPEEDVFYQVFRGVYDLDSIEDIQNLSVMIS